MLQEERMLECIDAEVSCVWGLYINLLNYSVNIKVKIGIATTK
jgi:hypothetical protein